MIDSMNLKLVPSDELLTFAQRSVGIFSGILKTGHPLLSFFNKASVALDNYNKAMEREIKNPFTKLLVSGDFTRDNYFYAFRFYIEAFSYRMDNGYAEAANKILDIIHKHGWTAPSMSYKAQTAAVTMIIDEIKTKCMAEIKLLNADEWFKMVVSSQDSFEALQKESIKNSSNNGPTILETRPILIKTIKDLFKMTDLKLTEEPDSTEYKAYVNAINELISITMSTARANATRLANKKKKEENGTNPVLNTSPETK
jgi:hypothetical protein